MQRKRRRTTTDGVLNFHSRPFLRWRPLDNDNARSRLLIYAQQPRLTNWNLTDYELDLIRSLTGINKLQMLANTTSGSDANNLLLDVAYNYYF